MHFNSSVHESATTTSCNRAEPRTKSSRMEHPGAVAVVVRTPQRKARYSDKTRVRFADIKAIALRDCRCRDTKEMKQRLRVLGIRLNLRLTSAWIAIAWELQPLIEKLGAILPPTHPAKLPIKKVLAPVSPSERPVFSTEEEAMNYYLGK